jgi:primosomal protein N' (replication factor Y)
LHGVTGSGKTEVYLQCIEQVLARGEQVLFLVPEIGLTPQAVDHVRERFGVEVGVLHSGLNDSERHTAWWQAREGSIPIILGTRSAVFTPFSNLGLIVIDEEHDSSFKQQEGVRYHARDFAIYRAMCEEVPIILGSATPSLESLKNARDGHYLYLRLPERVGGSSLPEVGLLDMRGLPASEGFSPPLLEAIKSTLEQNEQALVFLNRRGFAPLLFCRDCDWRARCHRCDSHLTHHQGSGTLRCHHCGYQGAVPQKCPDCRGENLVHIGEGTERLEAELVKRFPDARIARIDRDSTRRKGELEALLNKVRGREVDIVLGTQLLTKGHDFSGVTLVGIVNVDQGLFSIDFRAAESLFQQVMQVAGRAGRRRASGQVLIQTWVPGHNCFQYLTRHDYDSYSDELLAERQAAGFPPYGYMALLRAEAARQGAALRFLHWAKEHMPSDSPGGMQVTVFDPVPSPMERRAGRFRAQLMIRADSRKPLHELLARWLGVIEGSREASRVRWSLDVDPVDMY